MDWGPLVGIIASFLAVWLLFLIVFWLFRPRDVGLRDLVRIVPDVLRLVRDLVRDDSVPLGVRAAAVALIAWLLNPIDLIPEFIPVLGPLDDVVVAVLVLRYMRRRLGADEFSRAGRGPRRDTPCSVACWVGKVREDSGGFYVPEACSPPIVESTVNIRPSA